VIFLGFWQFSAEGRLRPTILRFSKKAYFWRGSKRFRYYYMQEVVPCCAIFAKLQNSLIQPRTSQKKFSLFENVSYFVFIVWRSTDRQFFYSPIRRAWAISTGFFLDFCTKVKEDARCARASRARSARAAREARLLLYI
jgi:hypothetical protein